MFKKSFFIITPLIYICFGFQAPKVKTDSISLYLENKKPLKALNYSRKLSETLLNQKKYIDYCYTMHERALLFENLNDNENALKTLFEYIPIAEKYNLKKNIILFNIKVGNLYTTAFNFSKAKKYLYKAKKKIKKCNDKELLISINQALFRYHNYSESDSVEYYLNRVIDLSKDSKDPILLLKNYNNSFQFYNGKKDFIKAKYNIERALRISPLIKDKIITNNVVLNYGLYLIEGEKNYKKAITFYINFLKNTPKNEDAKTISKILANVSYCYEMLGDYKMAMDYNNKFLELQDVVFNDKLELAAQEMETKYQVGKVEEEYKHKTKELVERQERNQKLMYLLLSLLVLVAVIFYVFFQNLKLKQKNKIKDLDTDLQYKIISATLDGQDQERNKISEVLHDNVSATLSSVGLHLSAFESNLTPEQRSDLRKTRALLKQAHDKVRDLSHELVPPLLVKFGLQFALKDLCENNSNSIVQFTYNSELPKNKKFDHEFETKIYYFVSELFNNAMKHSQATEISLDLKEMDDKLQIIVSDNGIGFNTKEQPLGFGLTQIKARVKNMNGNVKLFSKPNEGTIITITVKE